MFWKDVVGYENLYKISKDGEVYGLKSKKNLKKLLTRGYEYVNLYKNGKMKRVRVHRLVAIAFIPNPEDKPQVNHKDGNKQNNAVSNLEWATGSENMIHAYETGLQPESEIQKAWAKSHCLNLNEKKKVAVLQYDLKMNLVGRYESVTEASKAVGEYIAEISKCCRGKRKTAKGFIWKYEVEKESKKD